MRMSAFMLGAALFASPVLQVYAQDFPSRTIRIIVPGAPGGSADIVARLLGKRLSAQLGQPVVVENRGGAGQMIGADLAAKATDGHTMILVTVTYSTSAATQTKLAFDPVTDLTGVTMIGEGPLLVTVHPSLPVKSVKELVALARKRPGELNYASPGAGTIIHLVTEVFAGMAKINIVHVPYKSIAPAVTDTAGGHVEMLIASVAAAGPQIKAGRLRALAVTTAKPSRFAPGLPTVSEAGVPGYEAGTWWGILTSSRTPASTVSRLNAELQKALTMDEVQTSLTAAGAEPVLGMSPAAFSGFVKSEIARWRKVVAERNIRID